MACEPGTFLVGAMGSASGNELECTRCPPGTYNDAPNALICTLWTDCEPGEYVADPGNARTDRSCAACPAGEYSVGFNAEVCVRPGECLPGTVRLETATLQCAPCAPGSFCAGSDTPTLECEEGTWDDDLDAATPCAPKTPCETGQYVVSEGTTRTDRVCADCSLGEFSDVTNAPACTAWTNCAVDQFVEQSGDLTRDRSCADCTPGTSSEIINAASCSTEGRCPPGSVEVSTGSIVECTACESGRYCPGDGAPEEECLEELWDDDRDPSTPCVPLSVCPPGEYVVREGTVESDRTCAECDDGEFSDITNAPSCEPFQACEPGEYVVELGTSVSDRVCVPCPSETYSDSPNAAACTPWSVCSAPAYYQLEAPSATNDRTCELCELPAATLEDDATSCPNGAFQLVNGLVTMEAEHYDATTDNGSSDAWQSVPTEGISGNTCMQVGPDTGDEWSDDPLAAPRLDYRVNFTAAGSYYVHIRGAGGSCLAGVDGTPMAGYFDFSGVPSVWSWQTTSPLIVDSAGIKTLSVWAREDGLRIDKVVLNPGGTVPIGNGTPESAHE